MTSIICDACKKTVSNAVRERNFHTVLDKSLCLECNRELEATVSERIAERDSYQFTEYKQILRKVLAEKCR